MRDSFCKMASFFWWWTWKEVHQVMFWLLWWPRFWWSPTWKLCDTYLYLSQLVCHAILNKSLRTRKNGRQVFPNNCFSFCMCQAGLLLLFTAAFSSFVRKLVSRTPVSFMRNQQQQCRHSALVVDSWLYLPQEFNEANNLNLWEMTIVTIVLTRLWNCRAKSKVIRIILYRCIL